jgi:hypothetical protein
LSALLSGLVGGYSTVMLDTEKRKSDQEHADKRARAQVLEAAIASGRLTPEAQDAAMSQIDELLGGGKKGKGGKGGGFSFKDIAGRLTGRTGGQPQESLESATAKRQGASAAPQNGAPKGSGEAPEVSLGQPPQAPKRNSVFKTQDQLNQEAADAQTKAAEAKRALDKKWRAEDAVAATEAMNKAKTPEEKAIVEAEYGIKMPLPHFQAATVQMPDGSVRPAGYDPQTNQYLEPGTNLVLEGATKYIKPTTVAEKRERLINAYMNATDASRADAEKWADKQSIRQEEAKGAPVETHSQTLEPGSDGKPVIKSETNTVRSPKVPPTTTPTPKSTAAPTSSGPVVDSGVSSDGKVNGAARITKPSQLDWAVPKEGRVAIRKATDDYESDKARYSLMKETEDKIKKDPKYAGQGDMVILFNHVAILRGVKTNLRPTQTMIEEAKKARTLPEGIQVAYTHGFVSGATLSPIQRHYMVETAAAALRAHQKVLLDEQVRYGVKVHVQDKKGTPGYVDKSELKLHPDLYTEIP